MKDHIPEPEFVKNPETRCPLVLLLDTSGSMAGERINALNQGLKILKEDLSNDITASLRVEIAIITFGGSAKLVQNFCTVDKMVINPLQAGGGTPMGYAIGYAIQCVERRKEIYKANNNGYYRPWIFLITDGEPTDQWQEAARNVHEGEGNRKHLFWGVGVQGTNFEILKQICPPNRPPLKLKEVAFRELFLWLSASQKRVSQSKVGDEADLPPVTGWGKAATS
jgi:uncharacterized protein YegL